MELKYSFLVLAAAVAVSVCHPTTNQQLVSLKTPILEGEENLGIYDGQSTTIQKHPYIVAVVIESKFDSEGSIVSDTWVVTLADGVSQFPPNAVTIIAGSNDAKTGTIFKSKKIVVHPKYGQVLVDYDYACIQIQGNFKFSSKIQPVKLPSQAVKVGTTLLTAGWGDTAPSGEEGNNVLKEGQMKWLDKKVCNKLYSPYTPFTDRMACVYNKGKTTLCKGDWGDAFIYKDVYYGHFVMGLTNGFCTSTAEPIVLADIYTEVKWIKKVTGAKSEDED